MTDSGDPGAGRPLLIACALGIERLALGRPGGAAGPVTVVRTGMGPEAAGGAVARALRDEREAGGTAVLVTGFCAGLVPGMRPGDLVVADETRDAAGGTACTGARLLADALRPHGTVHVGPLVSTARLVRGAASRAALHARTSAVAADMESAAALRAARPAVPGEGRPVAAVRVVVDAPGHELIRPGTLRGGISAFRVLRGVMPVFLEWHRSLLLSWR